ncbi:hypothetical protein PWT90_01112 [Aphanocladium album]|nr:hypothetical protein PWT90_01112 [Aphanocladium album]
MKFFRVQTEERSTGLSRVCDNCVRKKVKCNLERPTCSRCRERGEECRYSSKRRKPGPIRGARRVISGHTTETANNEPVVEQLRLPETPEWPERASDADEPGSRLVEAAASTVQLPAELSIRQPTQLHITSEEEQFLLDHFAKTIHNVIPVFSRTEQLVAGLRDRALTYAIIIITAKIAGFAFSSASREDLEAEVEVLLSTTALQDSLSDSPSLDEFRRACVLSLYEFHQFPGRQAWTMVARLAQVAYWMGLHRFDSPMVVFPDRLAMDQETVDDWRLVWWCIYRLDSYSSLTTGTPYMIEEDTIQVMLPQDNAAVLRGGPSEKFLSPSIAALWELLPSATLCTEPTMLTHVHLITVTIMRQAGRCLRRSLLTEQRRQRANGTATPLHSLEQHLSALRLALPTNYLSPTRNVLQGETQLWHHQRLVTVLHLHGTKLLVAIAKGVTEPTVSQDWLQAWQQIVESSLDIALVSENWHSTYSL